MEEIEELDMDDNITLIKKQDNESIDTNKNNDKIDEVNSKRKHKSKRKKITKCERIFVIINILIILGIIGFYAYRTIYYYKLSHSEVANPLLIDKLTNLSNIAYQNDGLYEKNGYFYYKGLNVDNYVYYSGHTYRIIDITSDGIRMIDNDTSTNLIWGLHGNYNESLIQNWLSSYVDTLKDYDIYLKENHWCNQSVDIQDYHCDEYIKGYVGLLSTNDYLQAGGKNSYLNNGTYFWTINSDKEEKPLYINSEGGINNVIHKDENYYSYGIRPVITLSENISIIDGDGKEDTPFIIENLGNALLRDNSVGSYVKYSNKIFRITAINESGITLMQNDLLEVEKNYNDVISYLNNDYMKELDKNDLVKIESGINEYNYANQYNYKNISNVASNYVTIPKIGDLFLNDCSNYWLNTVSDSKLGLYYILDENKMFFGDLKSNKHFIRPVIKLNSDIVVNSGIGTIQDPLLVGDNNVEED